MLLRGHVIRTQPRSRNPRLGPRRYSGVLRTRGPSQYVERSWSRFIFMPQDQVLVPLPSPNLTRTSGRRTSGTLTGPVGALRSGRRRTGDKGVDVLSTTTTGGTGQSPDETPTLLTLCSLVSLLVTLDRGGPRPPRSQFRHRGVDCRGDDLREHRRTSVQGRDGGHGSRSGSRSGYTPTTRYRFHVLYAVTMR